MGAFGLTERGLAITSAFPNVNVLLAALDRYLYRGSPRYYIPD
jgi:hypothetical protein